MAVSPIDDTMIISFDLDAGRSEDGIGGGHGMDELSTRHLGHTTLTFKELCGTGKKAIPFGEVPLDRATEYAAEDAEVTWRLHRLLKPRLADEAATRVYERVDRPLIPVVAQMERHGIKVDRERLSGLSATFADEIAKLEAAIHEAAGQPFTIGSPKQLGEVLFDKLGYKGGRKSAKSGRVFDRCGGARTAGGRRRGGGDAGTRMAATVQAALDLYRSAASRDQS